MLNTAQRWVQEAEEVLSIADASLGGLRGRSALLLGSEEQRRLYLPLLQQAGMKSIFQEEAAGHAPAIIPFVQLLISAPDPGAAAPSLTAAAVARGCIGRRTPLLIFDLSLSAPSVEELAGLLPAVCLYTPEDLRHILSRS